MITASKETKSTNVKAQGTGGPQIDCPMTVSQNIDIYNIKLRLYIKYRRALQIRALI